MEWQSNNTEFKKDIHWEKIKPPEMQRQMTEIKTKARKEVKRNRSTK